MRTIKNNQTGFSAVELVLILIIVIAIAGVGLFVYQSKQTADKTLSGNNSTTPSFKKKATTAPDPTADWVAYSSTDGHYSLKYPKTWVTATHPDLCSTGILLVAPSLGSVGACASENDGEIAFISVSDSSHLCYDLDSSTYSNITKSTVAVSGVTLTKQSGTTIDDSAGNGALPKGTVEVNYCYGGSSQGFMALYDQRPTDPDALSDFNTVVTKTLKFE